MFIIDFPVPFKHETLTHWGWAMHICVGKLTIIGSDDGLSPGRRQAIIWTNAGISLIGTLGTNFSAILIKIQTFSFKKLHLKMLSAKWRPFCLGLNMLIWILLDALNFSPLFISLMWIHYNWILIEHYGDVIMDTIASQITSLAIVFSTVYLDIDQRKHQSSASLAFVWGIHRGPVNSPHKWPVMWKMFPFDDGIMNALDKAWVMFPDHIYDQLFWYRFFVLFCSSATTDDRTQH